jgi:hypothetical protein
MTFAAASATTSSSAVPGTTSSASMADARPFARATAPAIV